MLRLLKYKKSLLLIKNNIIKTHLKPNRGIKQVFENFKSNKYMMKKYLFVILNY